MDGALKTWGQSGLAIDIDGLEIGTVSVGQGVGEL